MGCDYLGKPTQFETDTGSEVSVISHKAHRENGSPKLYLPQRILQGPTIVRFHQQSIHGQVVKRKLTGAVGQELYAVENLRKQLLGFPAVEALDLAVHVQAVEGERRSLIDQFPKLFQGEGKFEGDIR